MKRKILVPFLVLLICVSQVVMTVQAEGIESKEELNDINEEELNKKIVEDEAIESEDSGHIEANIDILNIVSPDAWVGESASIDMITTDGTKEFPYEIDSGNQLQWLKEQVEGGTTFEGEYFILTKNIHLNAVWETIGDETTPFMGNIDGRNHTISGININQENSALFGSIQGVSEEYAEIKNLHIVIEAVIGENYAAGLTVNAEYVKLDNITITANKIESTHSDSIVGGLIAEGNYVEIENCEVSQNTNILGINNVGGLIGYGTEVNIHTNQVSANIYGNQSIGGIAGNIYNIETDMYIVGNSFYGMLANNDEDEIIKVGGLIGSIESEIYGTKKIYIQDNLVKTDLIISSSENIDYIGGIIGYIMNDGDVLIENTSYQGTIDCNNSNDIRRFGGLIGVVEVYHRDVKLDSFFYTGDILMNNMENIEEVGGLIGAINAYELDVTDCTYNGNISINDANEIVYIGGLMGRSETDILNMINCNYAGDITLTTVKGAGEIGGMIGVSYATDSIIMDCVFTGDVSVVGDGESTILGLAGIIASNSGTTQKISQVSHIGDIIITSIKDAMIIGGMIAEHNVDTSEISDTIQNGNIKISGNKLKEIFGIAGFIGSFIPTTSILKNCTVTGMIDIKVASEIEANIESVGGIIGFSTGKEIEISTCSYTGDIFLSDANVTEIIGGIIADGGSIGSLTINSSYHYGGISIVVSNDNDISHVGPVGGFIALPGNGASIYNSYHSGDISIQNNTDIEQISIDTISSFIAEVGAKLNMVGIYATGDINYINNSRIENDDISIIHIGGLIGLNDNLNVDGNISQAYYVGNIDVGNKGEQEIGIVFGSEIPDTLLINSVYYDAEVEMIGNYDFIDEQVDGVQESARYQMIRENANSSISHLSNDIIGMIGFDFDNVWVTTTNEKDKGYYPQLQVFANNPDFSEHSKKSVETNAYYYVTFNTNGGEIDIELNTIPIDELSMWRLYDTEVYTPVYKRGEKPVLSFNTQVDGRGTTYTSQFNVSTDLTLYAIYDQIDEPGEVNNGDTLEEDEGKNLINTVNLEKTVVATNDYTILIFLVVALLTTLVTINVSKRKKYYKEGSIHLR